MLPLLTSGLAAATGGHGGAYGMEDKRPHSGALGKLLLEERERENID